MTREKKFRSLKRCLKNFNAAMLDLEDMIVERNEGEDYWHLKIPIAMALLTHKKKTTKQVLNQYIQSAYKCYLKNKNDDSIFTLILSSPGVFSSEVCIFYSKEYYESFQDRSADFQKWEEQKNGLVEELGLIVPEHSKIINYKETIVDEEYTFHGTQTIIRYS